MQAFYPLKIQASAPKASRPGSTSIFPCPWRRQSACKPAKKSSGNCWIALNYTWYENSYLSSKPLKGQAKATKLLCRPPQNRLPKTNGAAAPTQVAPDPPVRENLIHDFLSAYEILGLGSAHPAAASIFHHPAARRYLFPEHCPRGCCANTQHISMIVNSSVHLWQALQMLARRPRPENFSLARICPQIRQ